MPLSPTPAPTEHWEGHGGVTIAGDALDPPNGPPTVFLQGVGQTRHAWRGAFERVVRAAAHLPDRV